MKPRGEGGVSNVAHSLTKSISKKVDLSYFPHFAPQKCYLSNSFHIYRTFLTRGFDILHFNVAPSWGNGSNLLLRFAKKRGSHTIFNVHGIIPLEHILESVSYPMLISYKALLNVLQACRAADIVVVNSEYMRDNVAFWYKANRDKIVVIPNGVNLKKFSGFEDKLTLEGDPAILYLGRLSTIKGVDVLVKAIARLQSELPNMKLHLVGSGYMSAFQLLVKEKKIEKFAVFHGKVAHSIIQQYYRSADICVCPSIHEGFGLVTIEAMASGIPLIASNIRSFREIISNGKNGMLFEPGNDEALAKIILALYKDSDLRKKISEAALKSAAKYDWENIAERYIALYKGLYEGTSFPDMCRKRALAFNGRILGAH
jgi:glycosyltransferase involved in cell wall biosynthesis